MAKRVKRASAPGKSRGASVLQSVSVVALLREAANEMAILRWYGQQFPAGTTLPPAGQLGGSTQPPFPGMCNFDKANPTVGKLLTILGVAEGAVDAAVGKLIGPPVAPHRPHLRSRAPVRRRPAKR